MPRGHEHDPIYSLSIYARFSGQFFLKLSYKKVVIRKIDRCAVFGCNNDRHRYLFSHYNLILRKLYEKLSRKALESTNEMCSCPLGIL